jgi:hypothetical protein
MLLFPFYFVADFVIWFYHFSCALVGLAYPVSATFYALQTPSKEEDTQWLTYWVFFASFSVIELPLDLLLHWSCVLFDWILLFLDILFLFFVCSYHMLSRFPSYFLVKAILLVWAFHPSTQACANDWKTAQAASERGMA